MCSAAAGIPCTEEGMLLVDTFGKTIRLAFKEKDGVGPLARATTPLQGLLRVRSPQNGSVKTRHTLCVSIGLNLSEIRWKEGGYNPMTIEVQICRLS